MNLTPRLVLIASDGRFVVAEQVVVRPRLRIEVLAGKYYVAPLS